MNITQRKKRNMDMLHGPIWNKLPGFALPVAATGILGQLFNAADLAIVGSFAGSETTVAVAAVGANAPVIGLVVNLFVGISLGAGVVISNSIGRNDRTTAHAAVHTSVTISLLAGILIALLGQWAARSVMGLMEVPPEVHSYALLYLRIYLLGVPVILLYNFEAAIFRSTGEARLPLLVLAGSGLLNVLLNLVFVAGFGMTVDGVAIATVVSNAVSAAVLFRKLCGSHDPFIRLSPRRLQIHSACLRQILWIGLPAGIQGSIFALSNIVVQSAINSLGTAVMAASGAAQNLEMITFNTLNGFGQACATFTGQNAGAENPRRCRRILGLCLLEGALVLAAAMLLIFPFGRQLLSIFDSTPEVVELGYLRLQYIVTAHFAGLVYEVLSGYLRGFGCSVVPAGLTVAGVCGVRLLWIWLVFTRTPTFSALMGAYPVSLVCTAVFMVAALAFYRPTKGCA